MNYRLYHYLNLLGVLVFTAFLTFISLSGCSNQASSPHKDHNHSHHHEPGTKPGPYPDRIVVTWTHNPATSFSVTWRTDSATTQGKALIAPAAAAPKFHRKADTLTATSTVVPHKMEGSSLIRSRFHTATFRDLHPDSLYAYKVGKNGHWSEWFHMRTASQENESFSFLYVGDVQNGIFSHWSRAIRAAYSQQPDARFIVHAGDLVNMRDRTVEWSRWNRAGGWIQSTIANIAVPGNHEYMNYTLDDPGPRLSKYWKPQFAFPDNGPEGLEETAYYIDYQGVRIIALNSNIQIDRQTEWLKKVLANTSQQWIIVTHHHPIYSSGKGRNNPEIRKQWQPLYAKYNVDLVLQGHDHTYARGQTANVTGGVNTRNPRSGTVYVNSVSGAKMYELRDQKWNDFGGTIQRWAENTQLFQVIRLRQDTLKYRAYTVTGQLYDAFDLVQQAGKSSTRMIERAAEVDRRTHQNTIPYEQ